MALNARLSEKWDQRLYNWVLWRGPQGGKVSSAYNGEQYNGTGYRVPTVPVQLGDALDVDALMERLRVAQGTRHLYRALEVWTFAKGTRGEQAALLAISTRTLYAHVEAGKALLEHMSHVRRSPKK